MKDPKKKSPSSASRRSCRGTFKLPQHQTGPCFSLNGGRVLHWGCSRRSVRGKRAAGPERCRAADSYPAGDATSWCSQRTRMVIHLQPAELSIHSAALRPGLLLFCRGSSVLSLYQPADMPRSRSDTASLFRLQTLCGAASSGSLSPSASTPPPGFIVPLSLRPPPPPPPAWDV